jgi:hypothetical protein
VITGIGTQYGNNWDEAEYISTNNWVNYKQAGYEKNKPFVFYKQWFSYQAKANSKDISSHSAARDYL